MLREARLDARLLCRVVQIGCVLMGFDININYLKVAKAFTYLQVRGAIPRGAPRAPSGGWHAR